MIRAVLVIYLFHLVSGHKEHKVHNIVLYPEKHSWCKTTPIKEVVGHPGCEQIEVDNNVCVGACFSYSIPRTEPTAPGEVAPYCDSCQPSRAVWKHVTLKCTDREEEEMTKRVEIIEDCACLTCNPVQNEEKISSETSTVDVPQLLDIVGQPPKGNSTLKRHTKWNTLLKQMLNETGNEDDETVERLVDIISEMKGKGTEENELKGLSMDEDEEQSKVDLNKLKDILSKMPEKEEVSVHRHHHHHHKDDRNPTLDVEPHHLRPAVEGAQIAYLTEHHRTPPPVDRDNL